MIFNLTKGISNCDFESVSDNGTTLFFLGLPIVFGYDIGESSAKQILNNYINKKINYSEIYGFYLICIHNSLDNSYLFFSGVKTYEGKYLNDLKEGIWKYYKSDGSFDYKIDYENGIAQTQENNE
ncbi:hypothetical protein N9Y89_02255 [bacterium]|nr:hypothetical protein [bacterium]